MKTKPSEDQRGPLPSAAAPSSAPASALSCVDPSPDWDIVNVPDRITGLAFDPSSGEVILCAYAEKKIVVLNSSYRVSRIFNFEPEPEDLHPDASPRPLKVAATPTAFAIVMWSLYDRGPLEGHYCSTALYCLDKRTGKCKKRVSFDDRLVLRVAAAGDGTLFLITSPASPANRSSARGQLFHHCFVLTPGVMNVACSFVTDVPWVSSCGIGVTCEPTAGVLQLTDQDAGAIFSYSKDGKKLGSWSAKTSLTGTVAIPSAVASSSPSSFLLVAYDSGGSRFTVHDNGSEDPSYGSAKATIPLGTKGAGFSAPQSAAFDSNTGSFVISVSCDGRHALAVRRLLNASREEGRCRAGPIPPVFGPVVGVAPPYPKSLSFSTPDTEEESAALVG